MKLKYYDNLTVFEKNSLLLKVITGLIVGFFIMLFASGVSLSISEKKADTTIKRLEQQVQAVNAKQLAERELTEGKLNTLVLDNKQLQFNLKALQTANAELQATVTAKELKVVKLGRDLKNTQTKLVVIVKKFTDEKEEIARPSFSKATVMAYNSFLNWFR
jgi:hypothetical protein